MRPVFRGRRGGYYSVPDSVWAELAKKPVDGPYCVFSCLNHMAYVRHVNEQHEPALHGKKASKRHEQRKAAMLAELTAAIPSPAP